MKRVAIIQSCYIPWRGFFDLIARCDEYIIYDQVAYRSGHWHNRNRIKTAQGAVWLTIPTSARLGQPIDEVQVKLDWAAKHWKTVEQSYVKSRYFSDYADDLRKLYEGIDAEQSLSVINDVFIRAIAKRLGLKTRITRDTDYLLSGSRNERLLSALLASGATHYLSGPSAKSYLDTRMFAEAGVTVEWMDYDGYPDYAQPHGAFIPDVSVVDAIFNLGGRSRDGLFTDPASSSHGDVGSFVSVPAMDQHGVRSFAG